MGKSETITVVGAGLVGSVMACYLAQAGFRTVLIERRSDPRLSKAEEGRSINLALSNRGSAALDEIHLSDEVSKLITPMKGRMMHDLAGKLTFQPYGKQGQCIHSISRSGLNHLLIEEAARLGCSLHFDTQIAEVDFERALVTSANNEKFHADYIIAADGAFSAVRSEMMRTNNFNYSQSYVDYGYKEITLPPDKDGNHQMEVNALHIWPRGNFMLIALPNMDGSYTCTLFLPFEGPCSFAHLHTDDAIQDFFSTHFKDVVPLLPNLLEDFHENPTSSLVTVRCFPWKHQRTLLVGDAAHAIVPFYGQGMNAGFEDCRIFMRMLRENKFDWDRTMKAFQGHRKRDADAIADLALQNFIEMRDLVADDDFLLRKKIEARIHNEFPEAWVPLYTMVTFRDDLRYSEARENGVRQKEIMDEVMKTEDIHANWEQLDFAEIVSQLSL